MILNDYETGGFPITRRSPVICFFSDGTVEVTYNRFELKKVIDKHKNLSLSKCLGVWPGKKNTDCFIINPEMYCAHVPPEIYADIDSAEEIIIVINEKNIFEGVRYTPGPHAKDRTPVISRDQSLINYIIYAGLKCRNVTGLINSSDYPE